MRDRADRLQHGIYFRAGERAPAAYRLLLMNFNDGITPDEAHRSLGELYAMLSRLAQGEVPELQGEGAPQRRRSETQFDGLQTLLGFGAHLFDPERALTAAPRPDYLVALPGDDVFPALAWTAQPNRGEADLAWQCTAPASAAVSCAAVECWKLIAQRQLPLAPVASFAGFGRPDGRGWLNFHDGVSNIESSQRLAALEAGTDPPWMAGGTYMAFLRLRVGLERWLGLSRHEQELIVGRDKLSGGALIGTERPPGEPVRPVAAPAPGPGASDREMADFEDPSQTTDRLLEASHIHRANQNRTSPQAPGSLRIFRQGYDFLDEIGPGGPVLGLNFVSFQRDLATFAHLMHLPGWLGAVNFGGPAEPAAGDPQPVSFIGLEAGGLYAVPPHEEPYPGASLWG